MNNSGAYAILIVTSDCRMHIIQEPGSALLIYIMMFPQLNFSLQESIF